MQKLTELIINVLSTTESHIIVLAWHLHEHTPDKIEEYLSS